MKHDSEALIGDWVRIVGRWSAIVADRRPAAISTGAPYLWPVICDYCETGAPVTNGACCHCGAPRAGRRTP